MRTWLIRQFKRVRFWLLALAVVALLAVIGIGGYQYYLATSGQPAQPYPALSIDGVRSLLVIAPHCDDETLSSGGLLQAALQRGIRIRVLIATAGDGYTHATELQFRTLSPTPQEYIQLGEMRQQESVNALAKLGVAEGDIVFLTYPEHFLTALWWDNWTSDQPYRSPLTQLDHSIYPRAFRPDTPFAGEAILSDLRAVIAAERPDLVLIPHANDAHPDHRTLNVLASLAVEMEAQADPTFRPRLLGYLVHYGLYPEPTGLRMNDTLQPPRPLLHLGQWVEWPLTSAEEETKMQAVQQYQTQTRLIGYYLDGFVRRNESFAQVSPVVSVAITYTQSLSEEVGPPANGLAGATEYTPLSSSVANQLDSKADVTSLDVTRDGDTLWVAAQLRGEASQVFSYTLYVRTFTAQDSATWTSDWGKASSAGVQASGHTISFPLDLQALGQPTWLAFYVETRQEDAILDSTAWYLISLESAGQRQSGR